MGPPTDNSTDGSGSFRGIHSEMATHSRQPYQIAVTAVFLALTIPTVITRFYVRYFMTNNLGADDILMALALVWRRDTMVGLWLTSAVFIHYLQSRAHGDCG